METAPLLAAIALAATHLLAGRLRFLRRSPRSRWLSFAGGVSVGYVLVHLLPELSASRALVRDLLVVEEAVFAVALAGLITFHGLEGAAHRARRERRARGAEDRTPPAVFWVHVVSFALYNGIVGYLLKERQQPHDSLVLYALAMALHFLVTDDALRRHHRGRYDRVGRWILAAAIGAGLALAYALPVGEPTLALLTSFLAGGIILNVLKEEVPEERESRFWPFLAGGVGYAALLLAAG